jgi:hypothetical protein
MAVMRARLLLSVSNNAERRTVSTENRRAAATPLSAGMMGDAFTVLIIFFSFGENKNPHQKYPLSKNIRDRDLLLQKITGAFRRSQLWARHHEERF